MSTAVLAMGMFSSLLVLVFLGFHIYIALGLISIVGVWLVTGSFDISMSLLSTTMFEALRDFIFAVIPLFVLMGELLARSGAATDLYKIANRGLRAVPGRLAVATVIGNAVFAAAVGVSIASAATFTRIAYPEMRSRGYDDSVALGCVAGSACLGMLIPPSVLLIIYGMLTETSIGQLFAAGILPGIVLSGMFIVYLIGLALVRGDLFGKVSGALSLDPATAAEEVADPHADLVTVKDIAGGFGTIALIILVLGGIWFGWFTPTEAAGVGALLALLLAIIKGMNIREIVEAILHTGRVSAPLLFLLVFGQLYSRLLSLGGAVDLIQSTITGLGVAPSIVLIVMVLIWFVLGMFIDSASILLLSIPILAPVALQIGFEPLQFAIIAILAIEAGILTPPLGLCVYTVKAAVNDPNVTLSTIFKGSIPYWIMLLLLVFAIALVPEIATYLPSRM